MTESKPKPPPLLTWTWLHQRAEQHATIDREYQAHGFWYTLRLQVSRR